VWKNSRNELGYTPEDLWAQVDWKRASGEIGVIEVVIVRDRFSFKLAASLSRP